MTLRTKFWGLIGKTALRQAKESFAKLPPYQKAEPVGLVPLDIAWGIAGTSIKIANDLPSSVLPLPERITQGIIHTLLGVIPNNQRINRWDLETATSHLTDFLGMEVASDLWPDWRTDNGWARAFVQGPCAGDLRREGDVYVVDASVLGLVEMRKGCAPLGVKVAIHVDEQGPRPAWIQMQDGRRVSPDQVDAWPIARLIAGAAMQNYVGMIRHVLNLHYIAAQCIAILVHNFLPEDHPVHRLMWPHKSGTLAVNWGASLNFARPNTIGVHNYALSEKGFAAAVPIAWDAFSWEDYDIPEVYGRRGTDTLIEKGLYPFGEDATLIWNTIYNYVSDYLSQYYASDADVANDHVLQQALVSLDQALPKPLRAATLKQLSQILTRLISMVSLEHKLVSGIAWNFFVNPYYFPTVASEAATLEEAAPYREEAEANVMFRYAISAQSWRMLEDWSFVALDEKGKAAMGRFQIALCKAAKEIERRNQVRPYPFPYLHPDGLEMSVAV